MEDDTQFQESLDDLRQGTPPQQRTAISRLIQLRDAQAVPPLLAMLPLANDEQVRAYIMRALGVLADERALPAIIAALKNDSSTFVRYDAAIALGHFPSATHVDLLIATLLNPDEHEGANGEANVVAGAATALAEIGDPRSIDALLESLLSTDPYTLDIVIRALRHFHDKRIVGHLLPLFAIEDTLLHVALCDTLGAQRDSRATKALIRELQSDSRMTREAAVDALGRIADAQAVFALLALLERETVPDSRCKIINALASCDDKRAVEPLLAVLADGVSSDQERQAAIEALGSLEDRRAVTPLMALLAQEQDFDLQVRAIRALGDLGDPRAVDALLALLTSSDPLICSAASEALGAIGDARAVDPLILVLSGDDGVERESGILERTPGELSRRSAAIALGNLGDPRASESLIVALRDPSPYVQIQAIGALGKMQVTQAADSLAELLTPEQYPYVRMHAARVLGDMGDLRAVEPLMAENLQNSEEFMRVTACHALGHLKDPRATTALQAALDDEDEQVRTAAALALQQIQTAQE